MSLLDQHKKAIQLACKKYAVDKLYAFGSVLTDKFTDSSDIDFVVSLLPTDPKTYADNYFNLKTELQRILKHDIDLLEQKAIRNKTFLSAIDESKQKIYENRS